MSSSSQQHNNNLNTNNNSNVGGSSGAAVDIESFLKPLVGQTLFYFDPVRAWELGTLMSYKRDPRSGLVGTFRRKADGEQVERTLKQEFIFNHTPGNERNNPDNLLALSELHHSLLINVLKLRHADDNVYTYLGDLVIAINPFKYTIPYYSDLMMGEYSNFINQPEIPFSTNTTAGPYTQFLRPHAWAVAHRAYVEMLQTSKKNHSVVISGESGAGKTETCKLLLKYLVHISGRKLREEFVISSMNANSFASSPEGGAAHSPVSIGNAPSPVGFNGLPIANTSFRGINMPSLDQNESFFTNTAMGGGASFAYTMGGNNLLITKELVEQREELAATINKRVQQANPILEAFGNAKTARNDNSSRFGKFMEVQFDDIGSLLGMRVTPFLLEKSRVVHCGRDERSYHCFYQLIAGASPDLLASLRLKRAKDYPNLDKGNCLIIRGVDDAKEFKLLQQAMADVDMTEEEQGIVWRVLAAVLHLQTIEFQEHRVTSAAELGLDARNTCEFVAGELLKLQQPSVLGECLVTTSTYVKQERIAKALTVKKAKDQRDSLCKYLYAKLFYWLVQRINEATMASSNETTSWIGLLDIFGFEDMQVNSFEQLCINLTNEVLQRNYTRAIFDKDVDDMRNEGISVEAVKYKDNAQCIELLQGPKNSILSFLDDASTLDIEKAQTDPNQTFLHRVTQQHRPDYQTQGPPKGTKSVLDRDDGPMKASDFFLRGKLDDDSFTIRHYAGDVKYKVDGFIEKNIDQLKESTQLALLTTTDEMFKNMLMTEEDSVGLLGVGSGGGSSSPTGHPSGSVGKKTAAATFRKSLTLLRDLLGMSVTHWVRCMRPHPLRQPGLFDGKCMLEQLVATGVLETVAQRQRNFPFRLRHTEFLDRFAVIAFVSLKKRKVRMTSNDKCNTVLVTAQVSGEKEAQVGTNKVFLSNNARQTLEAKRVSVLDGFVVTLQKYAHHFLSKEIACFLLTQRLTIKLQRKFRTKLRIRKAVKAYYEAIWQRMEEAMAEARRVLYVNETRSRTLIESAMLIKHEETYATFRRQLAPLVAAVLVNTQLVESHRRIDVENEARDAWRGFEQAFTTERVAAATREQQRLKREEEERAHARQYLLDAFLDGAAFIRQDEDTQRSILTSHIAPLLQKINLDAASVAMQMRERDAMLAVLEAQRATEIKRIEKAREERIAAEEDLWKQHIGMEAHQKDLAFLISTGGMTAEQCREHMQQFYASRAATAVVSGNVLTNSKNVAGSSLSSPRTNLRPHHVQGLGRVTSYREYAMFMRDAYARHATLNTPPPTHPRYSNNEEGEGPLQHRHPHQAISSPFTVPLETDFDEAVLSSRPLEEVVREREYMERRQAQMAALLQQQREEQRLNAVGANGVREGGGGGGPRAEGRGRLRDVGRLMLEEVLADDDEAYRVGGGDASTQKASRDHASPHANGGWRGGRGSTAPDVVDVDAFCGAWDSTSRLQQLKQQQHHQEQQNRAVGPSSYYQAPLRAHTPTHRNSSSSGVGGGVGWGSTPSFSSRGVGAVPASPLTPLSASSRFGSNAQYDNSALKSNQRTSTAQLYQAPRLSNVGMGWEGGGNDVKPAHSAVTSPLYVSDRKRSDGGATLSSASNLFHTDVDTMISRHRRGVNTSGGGASTPLSYGRQTPMSPTSSRRFSSVAEENAFGSPAPAYSSKSTYQPSQNVPDDDDFDETAF